MEFFHKLVALLTHLGEDNAWRDMVDFVGVNKLYIVLFAIVFCETGLVVTPFLPGDSLIFAIGAVAARDIGLSIQIVAPLLVCAALIGDNVNYWLGRRLGPAVFRREDSKLLNKKHLLHAQAFYEHHGSKTIILARFVPIVRTFAPFVAGIGKMNYARFLSYSIVSALLWVSICLVGGYFLGSRPFFKKHFELVILAIVFISVLPAVWHLWRARGATKRGGDAMLEAATLGEHSGDPR
ncbi:MAG TPA: VTT domain-containing protein [Tepidisphaeraceae bacterium]|jgi:membrane-associated protein|nr:VTT domain-containing protein [Tepidisphaeraceae bacterium]